MYDVIISGYYGFKNSGDDAILMAIINNLRMYKKDIKIMVLSMNPAETRRIYGVDSINRFNLFQILWAMKHSKLFINGGGSLIQDITSTRSLMYYLSTIWLAKKMGMKVMVYANGIGPIKKDFNRRLTQKIINQVDVITLREEMSKRELDNLRIDRPQIKVTADPALTLEAVEDDEIIRIFEKEGINLSSPLVGFSLRDWNECETGFEDIIAGIADYMIDTYHIKPVFIPMHYPRDLSIAKNIVSRMKGKAYVIKNKYSVPHMLGIIKKMDLIIGMRLHALIYAATFGIPVIGLVYEPKVEGFMKHIGHTSAGHVNQLQFDRLKQMVDDVWNRRHEIKAELEKNIVRLKEKALENAKIAVELIEKR
ncbi:polysaccharide pyruvyl transferase CsaB [Petroclostridium xylanilyticum]|uniref:polysaccharide pyruvyl transferase CsaB n=1 Tax=Petroclostridium xylanilyticum TaxID=1792311 RepID=UPI000B98D473|nr:polysaccharide pyruvyl transferase CsaB [Petroclostridium xylanilyticum]